jgi:hypothetical protein
MFIADTYCWQLFISYGDGDSYERVLTLYGFVPNIAMADAYHRHDFKHAIANLSLSLQAECLDEKQGPLICGGNSGNPAKHGTGCMKGKVPKTCYHASPMIAAGQPNRALRRCSAQLLNSSNPRLLTHWIKKRIHSSLHGYRKLKLQCAQHDSHYIQEWSVALTHTIDVLETSLSIPIFTI